MDLMESRYNGFLVLTLSRNDPSVIVRGRVALGSLAQSSGEKYHFSLVMPKTIMVLVIILVWSQSFPQIVGDRNQRSSPLSVQLTYSVFLFQSLS